MRKRGNGRGRVDFATGSKFFGVQAAGVLNSLPVPGKLVQIILCSLLGAPRYQWARKAIKTLAWISPRSPHRSRRPQTLCSRLRRHAGVHLAGGHSRGLARHCLWGVFALPAAQGRHDRVGVGAHRRAVDHAVSGFSPRPSAFAGRRFWKTTSCRRPAPPANRSPLASASPCRRCCCSASRWT